MPTNKLRLCRPTAQPTHVAYKTRSRMPQVVLICLQTHERRHMRYSLLRCVGSDFTQLFLKLTSTLNTPSPFIDT